MYPVFDISCSPTERPETLGSKAKRWVIPNDSALSTRRHLFKIGRAGTGENWSEKVACEICKMMQLPAANYDLAVSNGERGVISEQFFPDKASLIPGNTLLAVVFDDYDGRKSFRQVQYKLSSVFRIITELHNLRAPRNGVFEYPAIDYFVGYLIFDALIGNTDRHHENWGFEIDFHADELMPILAPTFDHASSLGRELTDTTRRRRLDTDDVRGNVRAYARKARTAFFGAGDRTMTSSECLRQLKRLRPDSFKFWTEKAISMDAMSFQAIFDEIPEAWASNDSVEFATALIRENQAILRECL